MYSAISGTVPPITWNNDAMFIEWKPTPTNGGNNPDKTFKPVRAAVMKSRFTTANSDNRRYYNWTPGQGIQMPQERIQKHIEFSNNIYKYKNNEWICVFDWESPAAHEYYNGNLTVRELRDTIDW